MNPFLLAYGLGWRLLLPPVRCLAGLDKGMRELMGKGILPGNWRVTERFGEGAVGRGGKRVGSGTGNRAEGQGPLWLHCASLGEAKGMWALALSLGAAEGLLLSATTSTGTAFLERQCEAFARTAEARSRRIKACMAPLDHPAVVARFLERERVRGLCLYEAELWPHYLSACRERNLEVALISGRLTAKAAKRYRLFGAAGMRLLDGLAWIQAQSESDGARFRALTKVKVHIGFDFKAAYHLDPVRAEKHMPTANAARFAFVSLHLAELRMLLPGIASLKQRFGLLVFPRHLSQLKAFRRALEPLGFAIHSREPGARHLLVDSLGLVGPLLRECHSVFVGGSFIATGCHNLWEPLAAGAKIHVGPQVENQRAWVELMRDRGIAEILAEPDRIRNCGLPGPGMAASCGVLVQDLQGWLGSALADGGHLIFATFYRNVNAGTAVGA